MLDIDSIRKDFPFLEAGNGKNPLVYFDNASTTQKPIQVLNKLDQFYRESNANVHRGVYRLSQQATESYENARKKLRILSTQKKNAPSFSPVAQLKVSILLPMPGLNNN